MSATETVTLSTDEAFALAKRLIARRAASDWLCWEDVPMLTEASFMRLADAVDVEVERMWRVVRAYEAATDIDSAFLLERCDP